MSDEQRKVRNLIPQKRDGEKKYCPSHDNKNDVAKVRNECNNSVSIMITEVLKLSNKSPSRASVYQCVNSG